MNHCDTFCREALHNASPADPPTPEVERLCSLLGQASLFNGLACTDIARCSAGIGNHGLPLLKPDSSASLHGIGVRQPSRPLKFGQKVMPYGSCSASNGTSASPRPSSSPW